MFEIQVPDQHKSEKHKEEQQLEHECPGCCSSSIMLVHIAALQQLILTQPQ